ncbi:MAG: cell division protein [Acidimicrobiales bacterium]|nr:cell division protein [Acidimicrobiales bacterium]
MALNANYVVRETTANLTRNITLTVASILTVFVSLAIVGTVVLVRQGAANMTAEFKGGVEFIVYVDPGITPAQLNQVRKAVDDNPGVKHATYLGQKKTYADFKRLFKDQPAMVENVRPQDLPTSFRVEPKDASVETVQSLIRYYQGQDHVYEVRGAIEVLREVTSTTNKLNMALTVFAAFLLVASTLLILNTIRTAMFARRREIEVMKLVGATNWFIRVPFLLEGLVQGLLGGALAVGFIFVARRFIDGLIRTSDRVALLRSFTISSGDVVLACLWVGISALLLSVASSLLATRRFLDV